MKAVKRGSLRVRMATTTEPFVGDGNKRTRWVVRTVLETVSDVNVLPDVISQDPNDTPSKMRERAVVQVLTYIANMTNRGPLQFNRIDFVIS